MPDQSSGFGGRLGTDQVRAVRFAGGGLPRRCAPNKKKGVVCSQVPLWQNFFIHGGSAAAGRWLTRNDSRGAARSVAASDRFGAAAALV